jgi:hypothetical protein
MYWTKDKLGEIEFPFLHDAVMSINRYYPVRSVYMDVKGGVCITVEADLERKQIQDCLFELHYFGPYSAAPVGPSAEELKVGVNFGWNADGYTELYSEDGVDYRTL